MENQGKEQSRIAKEALERQKAEKEANPTFAASVVDQIMARASSKEGESTDLRRRGCTITIFPEQCLPGYLTEPIKVGIVELTSDEELRAYRASGGVTMQVDADGVPQGGKEVGVPQQALAVAFGREAMRTINGRVLTRDEKNTFWEILGMTGRVAVGLNYMAHCTGAAEGFLERSMASVEVW